MIQNLIVALIVAAAALYVLYKYLPKQLRVRLFGQGAARDTGCGSGCSDCAAGCETPAGSTRAADAARPDQPRVIKLHPR